MRAIEFILSKLGLQTRAHAYDAGFNDVLSYARGASDAATLLGWDPIEVPAELLALPATAAGQKLEVRREDLEEKTGSRRRAKAPNS